MTSIHHLSQGAAIRPANASSAGFNNHGSNNTTAFSFNSMPSIQSIISLLQTLLSQLNSFQNNSQGGAFQQPANFARPQQQNANFGQFGQQANNVVPFTAQPQAQGHHGNAHAGHAHARPQTPTQTFAPVTQGGGQQQGNAHAGHAHVRPQAQPQAAAPANNGGQAQPAANGHAGHAHARPQAQPQAAAPAQGNAHSGHAHAQPQAAAPAANAGQAQAQAAAPAPVQGHAHAQPQPAPAANAGQAQAQPAPAANAGQAQAQTAAPAANGGQAQPAVAGHAGPIGHTGHAGHTHGQAAPAGAQNQGQQPVAANGGQPQAAAPAQHAHNFIDADGNIQPGHNFYSHVQHLYPEALAQGQNRFGGYTWTNGNTLVGRNTITGLQPVIDQAIDDILKKPANKKLPIDQLESKVANRLTQLNDWNALTKDTQEKLVNLTGIDFGEMSKAEREKSINHLLHSPLPFGAVDQALRPDQRIDLNYTHTLDQDKTQVKDLGNGLFNVTLISNNNNGSHTGHNLGSFNLQLAPGMTARDAKEIGNNMVNNNNNNNKLYLSEVARQQLANEVGVSAGPGFQQSGSSYSATGLFTHGMFNNANAVTNHVAHNHDGGEIQPGHDFFSHASHLIPDALAQGQNQFGGYNWVNNSTLVGRNTITGLQPVIEQAISDVMKKGANKNLPLSELEPKVANRLTQLNDWNALTKETKEKLIDLTGIDYGEMSKAEREKSINHLLHSPLPFGAVEQALRPDMRVDLAYTHTLDKSKTTVDDLGNGLFNITLISNNNNGSHTGHNLGSFHLQLAPGMNATQAKELANKMVTNTNNNNELYLSEVARQQLAQYQPE